MCKLYHGHSLSGYKNYVILNSICSCGSSIESTLCFLLHSPIFNDMKCNLLSTLNNIDSKILMSTDFYLTQTLANILLYVLQITHNSTLFWSRQPLNLFYLLKIRRILFQKKTFLFICNSLVLSEFAWVYLKFPWFICFFVLI